MGNPDQSALNILIVEDENIVAEDLRRQLIQLGYGISAVVNTGEEAITAVRENPPDIILMDIKLKGKMDGIEATAEIRKFHLGPILFLTAYDDKELFKRAALTEPDAFLVKPIREADLRSAIEISAYKQKIQQERKQQKIWIETILGTIQSGVIVTDYRGNITFINNYLCALLEQKIQDCLGKPINEVLKLIALKDKETEEIEPFALWHHQMDDNDRNGISDLKLVLPAGNSISIEMKISEIKGSDDSDINIVYLIQDIDKVRRYQYELEEEKNTLASLLGIAEQLSSTLDQEALLPKISKSVLEILKADHCIIFLKDDDEALIPVYSTWETTIETGYPDKEMENLLLQVANLRKSIITKFKSKEKSGFTSLIGVPIKLQKSSVGVIISLRDGKTSFTSEDANKIQLLSSFIVTSLENSKLYSDLQKSLEEIKQSREAWLRSEKLRALGEMADGVAHNFNNFLGVILSQAEVGRLITKSEELQDIFTTIISTCKDASETVKRLKTFTQKETKKSITTVNPGEIVNEIIAVTKPKWKGKAHKEGVLINIEKQFEFNGDVKADANALKEALTNVFLNAIDALPDGGTITVSTFQKEEYGCIQIQDSGKGIPHDKIEKIFEPFHSSKLNQGSGLGLTLAHKLITDMNGKIEIKSTPEKGTSVTVSLPLKIKGKKIAELPDFSYHQKPLSILLVDDEKTVLKSYYRLLSVMGHTITAADSPSRAIDLFASNNFDLVITDLGMPEMNGYQLAEKLKGINNSVPIILLTGWGSEGEEVDIARTAVSQILSKPCTFRELSATISSLIKTEN